MRGAHFAEGSSTFRGHSPYCPRALPTLHVLSTLATSAPRPNQQHLVRRQLEITAASCETQVQGPWNYAEFEGPPCRIIHETLVFDTIYMLCGGTGLASSRRIQRDMVSKTTRPAIQSAVGARQHPFLRVYPVAFVISPFLLTVLSF